MLLNSIELVCSCSYKIDYSQKSEQKKNLVSRITSVAKARIRNVLLSDLLGAKSNPFYFPTLSVLCPTRTMEHGSGLRSGQVSIFVFELTVDEDILDSF